MSIVVSLISSVVLIAADQLIKLWAVANLKPVGQMDVLPGIVELRFVYNDGMAFSMLSGKQGLLIGVTSVVLLGVLVWLFNKKLSLWERIAWTMIFAGGIGNLIDRVMNHQVVDYINVLFVNFAVFNFADICVTCGVGVLILAMLLEMWREQQLKNAFAEKASPAAEEKASVQEPSGENE